jgi:16S rRNA (cytidine1402-2'-O)-methyltransferase
MAIRQWYNKGSFSMAGTLFVVATPIGNLEDITARALRTLREVSIIAAEDTRRTAHLLARYAISTPTTSLHQHNEVGKTRSLLERLKAGDDVAIVSDAGTPTVSDPGDHLVRAAISAGVRVESIPGPSAILAALAASGLGDGTFSFLGFPPARGKERRDWFERLRLQGGTVVFFEAPHRIRRTLTDLQSAAGDCNVAIGRELTKTHEELVRGPISSILSLLLEPRGEFTVVAEIGLKTENKIAAVPPGPELLAEFCEMTKTEASGRRAAISSLSKRYGIPTREMYQRLEAAKKSG